MSSNFSISKFQKGTLPYSVSLLFFSIFFFCFSYLSFSSNVSPFDGNSSRSNSSRPGVCSRLDEALLVRIKMKEKKKRKESTKAAACVSCWSTPKHEREGVEYVVVRYIRRDDVYGCRLFRRGCNKTRKTLISDDRLRWFSLTVLAEQRRDNNEKIAHPLSLFDCFPLNSIVRLCLDTFSMTLKKERKKKTPNFSNNTFAFQSIP